MPEQHTRAARRRGRSNHDVVSPDGSRKTQDKAQGETSMLVLSRKTSERILIGDDVAITIVRIGPNSVRIGIEAPKTMNIVREELCNFGDRKPENHDVVVPAN